MTCGCGIHDDSSHVFHDGFESGTTREWSSSMGEPPRYDLQGILHLSLAGTAFILIIISFCIYFNSCINRYREREEKRKVRAALLRDAAKRREQAVQKRAQWNSYR